MLIENEYWQAIILIALLVALVSAIIAFIKTPRDQKLYRKHTTVLQEKLQTYPESAEAVIIKGNIKKALQKNSPYILISFVLLTFTVWSKNTENLHCVNLFGLNAVYIWFVLIFYGLPLGFLFVSIPIIGISIKVFKKGYFPPLDSIVFRDKIATKGLLSISRGILILIIPFYSIFLVYLGNNAYTEVVGSQSEMVQKLESKCQ